MPNLDRPTNRRTGRRPQRARRQRGTVLFLVALLVPVFFGIAALSVDVGNLFRVRSEGQRMADAAALAGASGLNGTTANLAVANGRAEALVGEHHVYDDDADVEAADIETGFWSLSDNTFTVSTAAGANAVRVTYTEAAVGTPFASIQGDASKPVGASAIALGGGPAEAECSFPLAVASGCLEEAVAEQNCEFCVQMYSANEDNGAWTSFENPNGVSFISQIIESACFDSSGTVVVNADGQCAAGGDVCSASDVTTEVNLNGGNIMGPAPDHICDLIYRVLTRNGIRDDNGDGIDDADAFNVLSPVVDTQGECLSAGLNNGGNGSGVLSGYAEMDIYGVKCTLGGGADNGGGQGGGGQGGGGQGGGGQGGGGQGGGGQGGGGQGGGGQGGGGQGGGGGGQPQKEARAVTPPNGVTGDDCLPPNDGSVNSYVLAALHRSADGTCDDKVKDVPAGGGFYGTLARPRLVQ